MLCDFQSGVDILVETYAAIYQDNAKAAAASEIAIQRARVRNAVVASVTGPSRRPSPVRTGVSPAPSCVVAKGNAIPLLLTVASSALGVASSPHGTRIANADAPQPCTRKVSPGNMQVGGGVSSLALGMGAIVAPAPPPRRRTPGKATAHAKATVVLSPPRRRARGAVSHLSPLQLQQQGRAVPLTPESSAGGDRPPLYTSPAHDSPGHRRAAALGEAAASRHAGESEPSPPAAEPLSRFSSPGGSWGGGSSDSSSRGVLQLMQSGERVRASFAVSPCACESEKSGRFPSGPPNDGIPTSPSSTATRVGFGGNADALRGTPTTMRKMAFADQAPSTCDSPSAQLSGKAQGGSSPSALRGDLALKHAGRGARLLADALQCESTIQLPSTTAGDGAVSLPVVDSALAPSVDALVSSASPQSTRIGPLSASNVNETGATAIKSSDVRDPVLQPRYSVRPSILPFQSPHRRSQHRVAVPRGRGVATVTGAVAPRQANTCAAALGIGECTFEHGVTVPEQPELVPLCSGQNSSTQSTAAAVDDAAAAAAAASSLGLDVSNGAAALAAPSIAPLSAPTSPPHVDINGATTPAPAGSSPHADSLASPGPFGSSVASGGKRYGFDDVAKLKFDSGDVVALRLDLDTTATDLPGSSGNAAIAARSAAAAGGMHANAARRRVHPQLVARTRYGPRTMALAAKPRVPPPAAPLGGAVAASTGGATRAWHDRGGRGVAAAVQPTVGRVQGPVSGALTVDSVASTAVSVTGAACGRPTCRAADVARGGRSAALAATSSVLHSVLSLVGWAGAAAAAGAAATGTSVQAANGAVALLRCNGCGCAFGGAPEPARASAAPSNATARFAAAASNFTGDWSHAHCDHCGGMFCARSCAPRLTMLRAKRSRAGPARFVCAGCAVAVMSTGEIDAGPHRGDDNDGGGVNDDDDDDTLGWVGAASDSPPGGARAAAASTPSWYATRRSHGGGGQWLHGRGVLSHVPTPMSAGRQTPYAPSAASLARQRIRELAEQRPVGLLSPAMTGNRDSRRASIARHPSARDAAAGIAAAARRRVTLRGTPARPAEHALGYLMDSAAHAATATTTPRRPRFYWREDPGATAASRSSEDASGRRVLDMLASPSYAR